MTAYKYSPKKPQTIKALAGRILAASQHRILGCRTDIEGILEDCGFDIIFRPLYQARVDGYIARDPHIVIVAEPEQTGLQRYRFTLAEEFSHLVLEFDLWHNEHCEIPAGARVHELTPAQHQQIEKDARCLAAELLCPELQFRERYTAHLNASTNPRPDGKIREAVRATSRDFDISTQCAALRAKNLGIITKQTWTRLYTAM